MIFVVYEPLVSETNKIVNAPQGELCYVSRVIILGHEIITQTKIKTHISAGGLNGVARSVLPYKHKDTGLLCVGALKVCDGVRTEGADRRYRYPVGPSGALGSQP